MKWHSTIILAAGALCTHMALAQGKIQFTWYGGESGTNWAQFQASFQVYDWELAPGTVFSAADPTHLFENTLSVISAGHTWSMIPDLNNTSMDASGNGVLVHLVCWDPADLNVRLILGVGLFTEYAYYPDTNTRGPDLINERGFWAPSAVPEPSTAALLGLGLLALLSRKAVSRS